MKLVHFELSGALLDDKTNFTEWIIESPTLFSEYVIEMHSQIEGSEGRFVLSESDKNIALSKSAVIILNPLAVDINTRKVLNKLYSELSNYAKSEQMYVKTSEFLRLMQEYLLELEQCTEHNLEYDPEIDITSLLKSVNVHYETTNMDFLESLLQYVKILADIGGIKLFIFVNLRSYLTDNQMTKIIREMNYQNILGIFIENQTRENLEGVQTYVIDTDNCEIF